VDLRAVIPSTYSYIFQFSSKSVQGFRSQGAGQNLANPVTLAIGFYNILHYYGTGTSRNKSVIHDQSDARLLVTLPAVDRHRPLAGTKLYCLITDGVQGCEQRLPVEMMDNQHPDGQNLDSHS